MDFDYAAWGSGEIVVSVLRALSLLTTSGQLAGALVTAALLSLLFLTTAAAFNLSLQTVLAPARMVLTLVLVTGVLLLPCRVTVTERFANQDLLQGVSLSTYNATIVAGVPFGVALPAAVASTLSVGLTTAIETVMSPVNAEDRLSKAGLWLSARALREMVRAGGFADTNLPGDFRRFVVNCTYFDVQGGRVDTADLRGGNLVAELGLTQGGLTSTHSGASASGEILPASCPLAWNGGTTSAGKTIIGLRARMEKEGKLRKFRACHSLQGVNLALNGAELAAAKTAAQDPVSGSASSCGDAAFANALALFGFDGNVTDQFRELVAIELMRDSAHTLSANDPQAIALATFTGRRQRDATYVVAGELAALTLPALRGLLEAVVLTLLPLLLILGIMLFDQFSRYLRNGFILVVWLQLWPPVMAVINNIGLWVQEAAVKEHSIIANGKFSLAGVEVLLIDLDTQLALARYMLVLVPLIAWALVRAGEFSGALLAGRLLQPGEQAAGASASHVASNNWSMDQVNVAARTKVGPHVATVGDSWGGTTTVYPQATTTGLPSNEPGYLAATHTRTLSEGLRRHAEQSRDVASERSQQFSSTVENAYQQAFGTAGTETLSTLRNEGVSDQTSFQALQGATEMMRQTSSKARTVSQQEGSTQNWSIGYDGRLSVSLFATQQKLGFSGSQEQVAAVNENMSRSYDQLDEKSKSALRQVGETMSHHGGVTVSDAHERMTSESFQATMREATGHLETHSQTQRQAERLSRASELASTSGRSVTHEMLRDPHQAALLAEMHSLYQGQGLQFDVAWEKAQENTGTRMDLDSFASKILASELKPEPQPVIGPAQPLVAQEANRQRVIANTPQEQPVPAQITQVRERLDNVAQEAKQQQLPPAGQEHYDESRRLDRTVVTDEGEKMVVANESLREKADRRAVWLIEDAIGLHDNDKESKEKKE